MAKGRRIMRFIIWLTAAILAGCSSQADDEASANAAVAPKAEKAPHCFFKDSETKDWAVKVAGDQAVVTGRGFRSDARYKVVLLAPKVDGAVAVVRAWCSADSPLITRIGHGGDMRVADPHIGGSYQRSSHLLRAAGFGIVAMADGCRAC